MTAFMEDVMKDLWSSRWLCLFLPAIVSTLGPMVLAATVKDVLADHATGTETQLAWQARLLKVEQAVAANEFARAELLWRDAYAAALKSRHWEGMVAVADTYRALGAQAGFRQRRSRRPARRIPRPCSGPGAKDRSR